MRVFLDRSVPVIFYGIRSSVGVLRKVNVAYFRIEKPGLNRNPTKTMSKDKGTVPSHPWVPSLPVFFQPRGTRALTVFDLRRMFGPVMDFINTEEETSFNGSWEICLNSRSGLLFEDKAFLFVRNHEHITESISNNGADSARWKQGYLKCWG